MNSTIGAIVITRDEEREIGECLNSLQWCDERLVVDSFSRDRTVEYACAAAEHVVRRSFVHHAEQKNWALGQLRTDWVLIVDADERVSPALADELRERADAGAADGYWIRRRNRFFGRVIRGAGWQRDRVLRFFRNGRGRYAERYLHEEVEMVEGATTDTCREALDHFSYRDWNGSFERLLSYSRRGAYERRRRGRSASPASLVFAPVGRFLRQYLAQGGWRDGVHGFALCAFSSLGVALRQLRMSLGEKEPPVLGAAPSGGIRVEIVQGLDREAGPGMPATAEPTPEGP